MQVQAWWAPGLWPGHPAGPAYLGMKHLPACLFTCSWTMVLTGVGSGSSSSLPGLTLLSSEVQAHHCWLKKHVHESRPRTLPKAKN